MKHLHLYTLVLVSVFFISCGGKKRPEISKSKSKDLAASPSPYDAPTRYEYTDPAGKRLIIQNSFPRGGAYTGPDGKEYFRFIFWTRLTNETNNQLDFKIDFPANSYEVPGLPGEYYEVLIPPDTMISDKEARVDYGMRDLKSFLDKNIHKPSSLNRTINSKESSGFYVVVLSAHAKKIPAAMRTGLSLRGQDLFYNVALVKGPPPTSAISEKEIKCGSISLKNLMLQK